MESMAKRERKAFVAIREAMDLLDDGHHVKEYFDLLMVSNMLMERFSPEGRQKAKDWCERKFQKLMEGA